MGRRPNAKWCKNSCKQKAYRVRSKGLLSLATMGRYSTVVIDPPWPSHSSTLEHGGLSSRSPIPYKTLSLGEIGALPVRQVLASDAWVFLWTTNRFLKDTFGMLGRWGCRYSFTMVWAKGGGPQIPNLPCFNAEYVVVGRKGKPVFHETKQFAVSNSWPRREHSEKPTGFYELLQRVAPGPRLDVFARRAIDVFDRWGGESPWGPYTAAKDQNHTWSEGSA